MTDPLEILRDDPPKVDVETAFLERQLMAAKRLLAIKEARVSLKAYMKLMMPDPDDPDNPDKTRYQETPQGDYLCRVVEETAAGKRKRTGVSMPPQHGKTEHLSKMGVAWLAGKFPADPIIMATYNEIRAGEIGGDVRAYIQSPVHRQVFPGHELRADDKGKHSLGSTKGGKILFTGKGGTITGRGARFFIVDDPLKDDEEAQSDGEREKLYTWFYSVAYSRGSKRTAIVILHTRWHEDDLLGRLCDPEHPERRGRFKGIAEDWTYVNLPGVITEPEMAKDLGIELRQPASSSVIEQFGNKPMAALWETERDLEFFAQWRRGDARTFDALVMGKPSPDEGVYFLDEWLVEYDVDELPRKSELRMYGASDHAVSEKQNRDYTVLGCVGVDKDDTIWVMPDVVWERMETDRTVENLLIQFKQHRPQLWWMENELISKSFGPFLKQRMLEERIYTTLYPATPTKDKQTRARAIQGRMSMKKVRFPRGAPWWQRAKAQLLRFPNAANDDFVDFLSHIGLGLLRLTGPARLVVDNDKDGPPSGSIEWILRRTKLRAANDNRMKAGTGW